MGNFRDYDKQKMFTFRESRRYSGLIDNLREIAEEKDLSFNEVIGELLLKVVKEYKKQPTKVAEKKTDFLKDVLTDFYSEYESSRGTKYLNKFTGKDRTAIGKLLNLYKKEKPEDNSEDARVALKTYFANSMKITNTWIKENVSPTVIVSHINQISKLINDGKTESGGATATEIAGEIHKNYKQE